MSNANERLLTGQVEIGTSPTLIHQPEEGWVTTRLHLYFPKAGSASVYIGDSAVTTSTGHITEGGQEDEFTNLCAPVAIYGVVAVGTQDLTWFAQQIYKGI